MALDYTKPVKHFSQMKAIAALVCNKLRKSQTLAIAENPTDTALQCNFKAMK